VLIQLPPESVIVGVALAAASVLKVALKVKGGWWQLIVIAIVLYLLLHGDLAHALGHLAPAPSAPSSARIEARGAMP
jgi:hypothetical protein